MRIDRVMGTVVTIDVRDPDADPAAVDAAMEFLHAVDLRFSPYRPESEVGRLIRGEIDETACADDLRHLLALAEDLRRTSDGAFDIRGHRPDGRPDPTGLVKGWAAEEAARILDEAASPRVRGCRRRGRRDARRAGARHALARRGPAPRATRTAVALVLGLRGAVRRDVRRLRARRAHRGPAHPAPGRRDSSR